MPPAALRTMMRSLQQCARAQALTCHAWLWLHKAQCVVLQLACLGLVTAQEPLSALPSDKIHAACSHLLCRPRSKSRPPLAYRRP